MCLQLLSVRAGAGLSVAVVAVERAWKCLPSLGAASDLLVARNGLRAGTAGGGAGTVTPMNCF